MTLKDIIWGAVVVVVATAVTLTILGFISSNGHKVTFGAVGNLLAENYLPYVLYNQGYNSAKPINTTGLLSGTTFQVGTTVQANQITTNCSPILNNSINATTTGYGFCTGVTGLTSSDNVLAQFATSTVGATVASDGFWIVGAKASTTAGTLDLTVYNASGKNAVPSAVGRAGSTTSVIASH